MEDPNSLRKQFYIDGFVTVKEAVDMESCDLALRVINRSLGENVDQDPKKRDRQVWSQSPILALFNNSEKTRKVCGDFLKGVEHVPFVAGAQGSCFNFWFCFH